MEESLKKLQFKKEQIVSLNDNDLTQVHGGKSEVVVTVVTAIVSAATAIWASVMATIAYTDAQPKNEFSKNYVDLDNGKACLLDAVEVHSIKTV